jgi:polyisoprenoid-binding protein YceI
MAGDESPGESHRWNEASRVDISPSGPDNATKRVTTSMAAPRPPYAAAVLPLAALVAGVVRWVLQGSGNVYTAPDKRFYVPDRDLGWRVVEGPLWLGLEVLAIVGGVLVAALVAAWIIGRREGKTGQRWSLARGALWVVAALPLAVPAVAFASGGRPAGAKDELPTGVTAAAPTSGIDGALDAPAGRYTPLAHDGTSLTAHLSAGGEAFDARFGGVEGALTLDPKNLTAAITGEITAKVETVDTGIALRSQHAREDYLKGGTHPTVGFRLGQLVAARADGPDVIAFRAKGTALLLGKEHPVEITGTLRALDAAGRQRLGIQAPAALIANADLALSIKETALAPDAGDFDGDRLPVHASLVLVHQP